MSEEIFQLQLSCFFDEFAWTAVKGEGAGSSASAEQTARDVPQDTEGPRDTVDSAGSAPDSPSKQLPDHISFFSGNPSVEIVHGIMHLYKTKSVQFALSFFFLPLNDICILDKVFCLCFDKSCFWFFFILLVLGSKMTSLTDDVRRSAMVCILTVPATMTSHDLMKLMAPFNEVMEHMKIIRDSTPNQYMVLIKFCTQVRLVASKGQKPHLFVCKTEFLGCFFSPFVDHSGRRRQFLHSL